MRRALRAEIGGIHARTGNKKEARNILEQLKRRSTFQHVPPDAFGVLYFYLGDKDEAFTYLNKGLKEHAEDFTGYKVAPWLDPLRSDPRFQDLVLRMKFPD